MSDRYEKPAPGTLLDSWGQVLNQNFNDIGDDVDQLFAEMGTVYNVKGHGIVGDGATDNTAELQDLLTTASSDGGGIVYFPPGTYYLSSTVYIPSNVMLRGAGMGVSTLHGEPTDNPVLEFDDTGTDAQDVMLEGLTFTQESEPNNTYSWYFYGTVHNVTFHNCEWRDLSRQCGVLRGSNYHIDSCYIQNTGRDGFLFAGVDGAVVSNCLFERTGDDSIAFNSSTTRGIAVGNRIVEPGYHHSGGGIKIHGTNCAALGNVIEDTEPD